MKKKWVVKEGSYGYWEDTGDCKGITDLKNCDKFRFWICAFLTFFDQIVYGAEIVRFYEE